MLCRRRCRCCFEKAAKKNKYLAVNIAGMGKCRFAISLLFRTPFHTACKHQTLLSADNYCLQETGNQQKFNKVNIVLTGALRSKEI